MHDYIKAVSGVWSINQTNWFSLIIYGGWVVGSDVTEKGGFIYLETTVSICSLTSSCSSPFLFKFLAHYLFKMFVFQWILSNTNCNNVFMKNVFVRVKQEKYKHAVHAEKTDAC